MFIKHYADKALGNYTIMSNIFLRDRRLSLKAAGLMAHMLALPGDWELTIAGLVTITGDGERSVRTALKELEKYGYFHKEKVTGPDGKIIRWDHVLSEMPEGVQMFDNEPDVRFAHVESAAQLITNKLNINNIDDAKASNGAEAPDTGKAEVKEKPKKKRQQKAFTPPTVEEVQKYITEKGYTVDAAYFVSYYTDLDWHDKNGNPVKNWKQKIITWKNNQKGNQQQAPSYRWTAPEGAKVDTTDQTYKILAKAAKNGRLGAEEQFAGLPVDLQKIIGSPAKIREWSKMQQKELDTALAGVLKEYRSQQPA